MNETHNPNALIETLIKEKFENVNISIIDSQLLSLFTLNNLLEDKKKPVNIVLSNLFDPKEYNNYLLWCQTQPAERVFLVSYVQESGCLVVNDPRE